MNNTPPDDTPVDLAKLGADHAWNDEDEKSDFEMASCKPEYVIGYTLARAERASFRFAAPEAFFANLGRLAYKYGTDPDDIRAHPECPKIHREDWESVMESYRDAGEDDLSEQGDADEDEE